MADEPHHHLSPFLISFPKQDCILLDAAEKWKALKNTIYLCSINGKLNVNFDQHLIQLKRFVQTYGYCFDKSDHIHLINFLYELIGTPGYLYRTEAIDALDWLMALKPNSSPAVSIHRSWGSYETKMLFHTKAFTLNWHQIYILMKEKESFREEEIDLLIFLMRSHFDNMTSEKIILQMRQDYCLSNERCFYILLRLLPTMRLDRFVPLLQDRLLREDKFLEESTVLEAMAQAAEDHMGQFIEVNILADLFNELLRPIGGGRCAEHWRKKYNALARIIVACYHDESDCRRMLVTFYEAHCGLWQSSERSSIRYACIGKTFTPLLCEHFHKRVLVEKSNPLHWLRRRHPLKLRLTEDNISQFVRTVRPAVESLLLTGSDDISSSIKAIFVLRPRMCMPFLLDQVQSQNVGSPLSFRLIARVFVSCADSFIDAYSRFQFSEVSVAGILQALALRITSSDIEETHVALQAIARISELISFEDIKFKSSSGHDFIYSSAVFERTAIFILDQTLELITRNPSRLTTRSTLDSWVLQDAMQAIARSSPPDLQARLINRLLNVIDMRLSFVPNQGDRVSSLVRGFTLGLPELMTKSFLPSVIEILKNRMIHAGSNNKSDVVLLYSVVEAIVNNAGDVRSLSAVCWEVMSVGLASREVNISKKACSVLSGLLYRLARPSISIQRCEREDFTKWGTGVIPRQQIAWTAVTDEHIQIIENLYDHFIQPCINELEKWCEDPKLNSIISSDRIERNLLLIAESLSSLWRVIPEPKEGIIDTGCPIAKTRTRFTSDNSFLTSDRFHNYNQKLFMLARNVLETAHSKKPEWLLMIEHSAIVIVRNAIEPPPATKYPVPEELKVEASSEARLGFSMTREMMQALEHDLSMRLNGILLQKWHSMAVETLMNLRLSESSYVRTAAATFLDKFGKAQPLVNDMISDLSKSIWSTCPQPHLKRRIMETTNFNMKTLYPAFATTVLPADDWKSIVELFHEKVTETTFEGMLYTFETPTSNVLFAQALSRRREPERSILNGFPQYKQTVKTVAYLDKLIQNFSSLSRNIPAGMSIAPLTLLYSMLDTMKTLQYEHNSRMTFLFLENLKDADSNIRCTSLKKLLQALRNRERVPDKTYYDLHVLKFLNDSTSLRYDFEERLSRDDVRPRNLFLQLNPYNYPFTKERWMNSNFMHGGGFLFNNSVGLDLHLTNKLPYADQSKDQIVKCIFNYFFEPENLKAMIDRWSNEIRREGGVNEEIFEFFRLLFNNFGVSLVEPIFETIQNIIAENRNCESKIFVCMEVFCGMINGSKYWNYEAHQRLKHVVIPFLERCSFSKLSGLKLQELFGKFMLKDCDCNKFYWIYETVKKSTFSCRSVANMKTNIFMLIGLLESCEWRLRLFQQDILDKIYDLLQRIRPARNVCWTLGTVLATIFRVEERLHGDSVFLEVPPDMFYLIPNSRTFVLRVLALEAGIIDFRARLELLMMFEFQRLKPGRPIANIFTLVEVLRPTNLGLSQAGHLKASEMVTLLAKAIFKLQLNEEQLPMMLHHLQDFYLLPATTSYVKETLGRMVDGLVRQSFFVLVVHEEISEFYFQFLMMRIHDHDCQIMLNAHQALIVFFRYRPSHCDDAIERFLRSFELSAQTISRESAVRQKRTDLVQFVEIAALLSAFYLADPSEFVRYRPMIVYKFTRLTEAPYPIDQWQEKIIKDFEKRIFPEWDQHKHKLKQTEAENLAAYIRERH